MSRLKRVTLSDFTQLIELAQETHYARNESIPRMKDSEINKLESSLNTPFQQFMGVFLYKGFLNKAAVLFYLLIKNHPLSNGNKRMACLTLVWFCNTNRYSFQMPQFLFEELAKEIAKSEEDIKVVVERIKKRIGKYVIKGKKKTLNKI